MPSGFSNESKRNMRFRVTTDLTGVWCENGSKVTRNESRLLKAEGFDFKLHWLDFPKRLN